MLHARRDYNDRIGDSAGLIGKDEPVFLLRAQDVLMLPTVIHYLHLLRMKEGHDIPTEIGVMRHISRIVEWQATHKTKLPDVEKEDLL